MRKKKKGAERGEGEASAIMVSQGALSCTLPDRRCFLGQGPASASRQGFTLVDTFKRKNTGIERGQGGREAAEGIYRVSFLQRERPGDAQRFVYSSLESQIPPLFFSPPLTLFFSSYLPPSLHAMCRASTRQRKELLYPLPPLLGFVGVL